jgi:hypothetical protein
MIENSKNKMLDQAPEIKAASSVREYHFGGSGKYVPMAVIASSIEEATEIWEKQRKTFEELNTNERTNL